MRLIDADALVEALSNHCKTCESNDSNECSNCPYAKAFNIVKDAPTINIYLNSNSTKTNL